MSDQLKALYEKFPMPGTIVCFDIGNIFHVGMIIDIAKPHSLGIYNEKSLLIVEPSGTKRIRSYFYDTKEGSFRILDRHEQGHLHSSEWDEWRKCFNLPLLPDRLHYLRVSRGLSMNVLGMRICSNGRAISKYERGETIPNRKTVLKLAIGLGSNVSFLCGWNDRSADL